MDHSRAAKRTFVRALERTGRNEPTVAWKLLFRRKARVGVGGRDPTLHLPSQKDCPMTRTALRIGKAVAVAVALGSGVLAVFAKPTNAWAQEATCWKEWCTSSGNICW